MTTENEVNKARKTPKKKTHKNIFDLPLAPAVADEIAGQVGVETEVSEEINQGLAEARTDPDYYKRVMVVYRDKHGNPHVTSRGHVKNREIVEDRAARRLQFYCLRPTKTPDTCSPEHFTRELTIVEADPRLKKLMQAVGLVYAIQEKRIAIANQAMRQMNPSHLDEKDKQYLQMISDSFLQLEKAGQAQLKRHLKGIPIYDEWLAGVRGVGPAISAILVAIVDIYEAHTPSALNKFMGLGVDPVTGRAERRTEGKKLSYDPWNKSKALEIVGKCLIKAKNPIYKKVYDERKHRRQNQQVPTCMGCNGTGKRTIVQREVETAIGVKKPRGAKECWNCNGTGGPAPWGGDDAHREIDARRFMVERFLFDFWTAWRKLEGLPIRVPYAEEYLGRGHHQKESVDGPMKLKPPVVHPEKAFVDALVEAELA